jgi:hypothetical protein
MEQPQSETEKQFEHSTENTRIESHPNELLAHVKERVLEQMKARNEKGVGSNAAQGFWLTGDVTKGYSK